jgi:hypothetical protein
MYVAWLIKDTQKLRGRQDNKGNDLQEGPDKHGKME